MFVYCSPFKCNINIGYTCSGAGTFFQAFFFQVQAAVEEREWRLPSSEAGLDDVEDKSHHAPSAHQMIEFDHATISACEDFRYVSQSTGSGNYHEVRQAKAASKKMASRKRLVGFEIIIGQKKIIIMKNEHHDNSDHFLGYQVQYQVVPGGQC